jgi:hypothetical protein
MEKLKEMKETVKEKSKSLLRLTPTTPPSKSDQLTTTTTTAESSVPTDERIDENSTTVDDEAASKPSPQDTAALAAPSVDTARVAAGVVAPLNPYLNVLPLNPSPKSLANLLGVKILDKAKSTLEPSERAVLDKYVALEDPARAFDEAYAAAETRKEEYKDKGVWTIKGHKVEWRALLGNIVKFLNKFKEVGDFLSGLDPAHAGIPWAVVKILLAVS